MLQVAYTEHQNAPALGFSPSPAKPKLVAEAIQGAGLPIRWIEPEPATRAQIGLAHHRKYVDGVLDGRTPNGHGNTDRRVAASLPYTVGAMLTACRTATPTSPAAALVSGFHHAGPAHGGGFCTFNGLMVAALQMLQDGMDRVAIVDCDQHYGDGTDSILRGQGKGIRARIFHRTFGEFFHRPEHAGNYLAMVIDLERELGAFRPDLIIFQAGADSHADDPLGGVLTTEQMMARDALMFSVADSLAVPIAWNLAGGYQRNIRNVVDLHENTFHAAERVYRRHHA